jgi:hypothetical protein
MRLGGAEKSDGQGPNMDSTTVLFDDPALTGEPRSDVDELRLPLGSWADPAAPVDGPAERHIVRSID